MSGKKILVADASLTILKVIRLSLSGDGYEIQTASDGQEAIEQASLFRPDICILDIALPIKDAFEIREEFLTKPDLRNIPVILMSIASKKIDEARMKSLGFAGHLIKPFDPSHLRSTLLSVANLVPENDPIVESIKPEPAISFEQPTYQANYQGDDIEGLAKSTYEMSGLDQQEWGVIEPMKENILPSSAPQAPSSFQHASGHTESGMQGFPEVTSTPTFDLSSPEFEELIRKEVSKKIAEMRIEIEAQVREAFKQECEKYSQAKLPALAETVLKEEIHKMLAHPPA